MSSITQYGITWTFDKEYESGQFASGDYWVVDLSGEGPPRKLGGDAPEASLLFARSSPDATRVAYVRANDIHVERLADGHITRLTTGGSETTINGTSDWVYEEELGVRDAFRWSPDSRSIAYWQFDSDFIAWDMKKDGWVEPIRSALLPAPQQP